MTTATALLWGVLVTLALSRLTRILTIDKISEPFRLWIAERRPEGSQLTYLLFCPWCLSVWLAAPAWTALYLATPFGDATAATGLPWWVTIPTLTLLTSYITGLLHRLHN